MAPNPNKGNKTGEKSVPPVSASPTRKKNPDRSGGPPKASHANCVRFKLVTIEGVAIGAIQKPDMRHDAFLGNTLSYFKDNDSRKEQCKLLLITQLRNPDGTNELLETANKAGNKYPTDIVVFDAGSDSAIPTAVTEFAREMSNVARNECRLDWKFGTPYFVNKGDATPMIRHPLSYYLLDLDCASVIRRIYENCTTKRELMNNPQKDSIFQEVFGSTEAGNEVMESIDDITYENL